MLHLFIYLSIIIIICDIRHPVWVTPELIFSINLWAVSLPIFEVSIPSMQWKLLSGLSIYLTLLQRLHLSIHLTVFQWLHIYNMISTFSYSILWKHQLKYSFLRNKGLCSCDPRFALLCRQWRLSFKWKMTANENATISGRELHTISWRKKKLIDEVIIHSRLE